MLIFFCFGGEDGVHLHNNPSGNRKIISKNTVTAINSIWQYIFISSSITNAPQSVLYPIVLGPVLIFNSFDKWQIWRTVELSSQEKINIFHQTHVIFSWNLKIVCSLSVFIADKINYLILFLCSGKDDRRVHLHNYNSSGNPKYHSSIFYHQSK